jgi:hypothetical protein
MALILAATSAATAAVLFGLLVGGFYVPVLVLLFGTLGATAVARLAVRQGHCRSPFLAGVAGLVWGLAVVVGSFHLDQCVRWGQPWAAVGQLPEYVAFRMGTDGPGGQYLKAPIRPRPAAAGQRPLAPVARFTPQALINGLVFLAQALGLIGGAAIAGVYQARQPYSERTRCWCSRGTRGLTARAERAFWRALADGALAEWVHTQAQQRGPQSEDKQLIYWYTPAGGDAEPDMQTYVSFGRRALLLTPEEAAVLLPVLPGLQTIAGTALPPEEAVAPDGEDDALARTQAVPGPYRGRLLPPDTRFCFSSFLNILLGAPLVLGGVLVFRARALVGPLAAALRLPLEETAFAFQAIGVLAIAVVWYWWGKRGPFHLLRRLENRTVRKRLAARPDPWVGADDPQAFFTEILARRFWENQLPHRPEDSNVGLLVVDRQRRVLLFEGDYERYRIPAGSILNRERTALPGTTLVAVVLQVRTAAGSTEVPLILTAGEQGTDSPKLAENLWAQLQQLCPVPSGGGRASHNAQLFGVRLP